MGRIKLNYFCPQCEETVPRGELKKGYEVSKDQYVILEDSDLEALPLKTVRQIDIMGFTEQAVDPRAFDTAYYISPDKGGEKAYTLLREVMERLSVKGIGKVAYREREHLCVISSFDGIFLVQTLCYADEIRHYQELIPRAVALSEKELELGETLVKQMVMEFEHGAFRDEYKDALEKLIEAKVEGREIARPAEAEVPAGDLVAQLLASIGMK